MNGKNYLLDTNAVIYLLNQNEKVNSEAVFYISFITELELLSYKFLSTKDESIIKMFFEKINIIDIDAEIKNQAIKLRKKYNLKLPDAIIAATSKVNSLIFITNDKDLFKIEDINIFNLKFLFK